VDAQRSVTVRTPGGHPLIRSAWIAAICLFGVAAGVAGFAHALRPAGIVAAVAVALLVGGYLAYLARHLAFEREIRIADAALDAGDLERARTLLSPLLERYPQLPVVQRAAGRTLYALGDPLSSASLLEKAARSFRDDAAVAATLVASYAALNRGGDARRAAALMPKHPDVRLALAWSELVALGGDRAAGAAIARELGDREDVRGSRARASMAAVLAAIASANASQPDAADAALREAEAGCDGLPAYERAFITYLEGVALLELVRTGDASRAFERAMEAAPGTIGEALARRELANLRARLAAHSSSSVSQPSSDRSSASNS
jgi:tetratricopeptide (TPR) repeat protein